MKQIIPVQEFSMETLRLAIITMLFRRKMHQQDLAVRVDCSPAHLSRVLSGQTQPSMELLLKIFEILDVKITLYDEEENV